jgi:hypothetical protein
MRGAAPAASPDHRAPEVPAGPIIRRRETSAGTITHCGRPPSATTAVRPSRRAVMAEVEIEEAVTAGVEMEEAVGVGVEMAVPAEMEEAVAEVIRSFTRPLFDRAMAEH